MPKQPNNGDALRRLGQGLLEEAIESVEKGEPLSLRDVLYRGGLRAAKSVRDDMRAADRDDRAAERERDDSAVTVEGSEVK